MEGKRFGWSGKILRIDLTSGKISIEPTEKYAKDFLGGRGINSSILFNETTEDTTAFDPENRLIFGTGPLVGTLVPGASRYTITTINALTGGHGDSNAGGHFSAELKFAGYDHIIFQGKAKNLVYVLIDNNKVEIRDAGNVRGATTFQTNELIRRELNDFDIQTACIGPAGENLIPFGSIHNTYATRASARCGVGAVMGSKNLKAVAVRGAGMVDVAKPEMLIPLIDKIYNLFATNPYVKARAEKGPFATFDLYVERGQVATKNFQDYHFGESKKIGFEALQPYFKRHVSCLGCPLHCDKYYRISEGMPWAGTWVCDLAVPPAMYFALLLISDANAMIKAFTLMNGYGIDEVELFYVIAWAIECYERGILTKKDTDGLELRWSDPLLVLELIRRITYKEGNLGRLLGKGVAKASREIGKGSEEYAMHMKGMAADDAKYPVGWGLGVSVSTRGPSHLHGALLSERRAIMPPEEAEKVYGSRYAADPKAYEDKPRLVMEMEHIRAVTDCVEVCASFSFWQNPVFPGLKEISAFVSAVTGQEWSVEDLHKLGDRIVNIEKAINSRAGLLRKDDYPPKRMFDPIPSGPAKGEYLDFSKFERMLDEYYELHGWDKRTGLQTKKRLMELGLEDIAKKLERTGKLIDETKST